MRISRIKDENRNSMKKVSIIVPVYNVEKYLAKCLDSLVNQTLEEMEIIVVDDESKDNSKQVIDEFQTKYPDKIKSFVKKNGGLSDARNFGLDRANGEYIGFVDSDDYVTAEMFEEMYSLAQKYDAEMVICNLQKVDENGKILQKLTQVPNMPEKIDLAKNLSVFSDLGYFACNKLFKRDLFENKRFKKGVHFEDIQLIPQLLLSCKTLAQTQNYHYQYLERQDSITKTHTEKGLDLLNAVKDVEEVFYRSQYSNEKHALRGFWIMEAVYSYLAYLAFVKDDDLYRKMSAELRKFIKERKISLIEILNYERFGKNYLVSLPIKKKVYYLLYFFRQEWLLRKMLK